MLKNYEAVHERMTKCLLNILRSTCKDMAKPLNT